MAWTPETEDAWESFVLSTDWWNPDSRDWDRFYRFVIQIRLRGESVTEQEMCERILASFPESDDPEVLDRREKVASRYGSAFSRCSDVVAEYDMAIGRP